MQAKMATIRNFINHIVLILLVKNCLIRGCDKTIVDTKLGKIQGFTQTGIEGDEFCSFLGIPYAKPPIGDLRFKDPLPADKWSGVRSASNYGEECTQLGFVTKRPEGSEDCLYLNIYTKNLQPDKLRPVMVWIHGGALLYSSGDDLFYSPDYFMRKDVVIVTLNYRLTIFGFLNLNDKVAPGNQGFKDQVMALKWVQDNIANFGGDPDSVTIFGESAGSLSVNMLVLSPMTKGLFQRAIMQSGVVFNPWAREKPDIVNRTYDLCTALGIEDHNHTVIVNNLRKMDANYILQAVQDNLFSTEERISGRFTFGPSTDDESDNPFMPIDPLVAVRQGIQMPILFGHTNREGLVFIMFLEKITDFKILNDNFEASMNPLALDLMNKTYHLSSDDIRSMYNATKREIPEGDNTYKLPLVNLLGDIQFVEGAHRLAKIQVQKSSFPTYLYRYDFDKYFSSVKFRIRTKIKGAAHGDDLNSMWRAKLNEKLRVKPLRANIDAYKLMENIIDMWVNFATFGDPTPHGSTGINIKWTPVSDPVQLQCLVLDSKIEMTSVLNLEEKFKNYKT